MSLFKRQFSKLYSRRWLYIGFMVVLLSLLGGEAVKNPFFFTLFCVIIYISITSTSFCVSRILVNLRCYLKKSILDKEALIFDLVIISSQITIAYLTIPNFNYFKAFAFSPVLLGIQVFIFLSHEIKKTLGNSR